MATPPPPPHWKEITNHHNHQPKSWHFISVKHEGPGLKIYLSCCFKVILKLILMISKTIKQHNKSKQVDCELL